MSVIRFSSEEFSNIVRVLVAKAHPVELHARRMMFAKDLEIIARANAACYRYRYGERVGEVRPITAGEIADRARNGTADLKTAIGTAGLLHYNCQENTDFLAAEVGGLEALVSILEALLDLAAERAQGGS